MGRAQLSHGEIRQCLGGRPDWTAPFPPKAEDMWRWKHEHMCRRYLETERRIDDALIARGTRLTWATRAFEGCRSFRGCAGRKWDHA